MFLKKLYIILNFRLHSSQPSNFINRHKTWNSGKITTKMNLYRSCLLSRGNTIKISGPINVVLSFSLMAGQISVAARNLGVWHISWTTPQIPSPNIPYTMDICDLFNLNFVGIGGFLFWTDSYRFYGYFYMTMEKGRTSGMWDIIEGSVV